MIRLQQCKLYLSYSPCVHSFVRNFCFPKFSSCRCGEVKAGPAFPRIFVYYYGVIQWLVAVAQQSYSCVYHGCGMVELLLLLLTRKDDEILCGVPTYNVSEKGRSQIPCVYVCATTLQEPNGFSKQIFLNSIFMFSFVI